MVRLYGKEEKVLTTKQMREADRRCIEELGIPSAVLMNNAGAAVFNEVRDGAVGVVCGKGNNGGDGFVVARLALLNKQATTVVLLTDPNEVKGDAAVFLKAYRRLGGHIVVASTEDEAASAVWALGDCQTLVDAMLGTGIEGEVRGAAGAAITRWPDVYTVAVDVPSGLNSDSGQAAGKAISADVTVTFQFAKAGFKMPGARDYLGRLVVADIGIPLVCGDDDAWNELRNTWK